MGQYPVVHGLIDPLSEIELYRFRNILDPAANHAAHMVVLLVVAIEAFDGTADFDLLDFSDLRQHFEVPIYRSQADSRQVLPNGFVELIRARMGLDLPKFSQDDPALPGHPQWFFILHITTYHLEEMGVRVQTSGPQ